MFAVGYGSFDFVKQMSGLICWYAFFGFPKSGHKVFISQLVTFSIHRDTQHVNPFPCTNRSYSLKNPSHPEYAFTTDSGVMCLDFHPQHSSLLCVGLYDGSVLVYDVRNKGAALGLPQIQAHCFISQLVTVRTDYSDCLSIHRPIHAQYATDTFFIQRKANRPIRRCDVKTGKHTDPVWQVKWAPLDLSEKDLKFYSVSSDGRVTRWQMSKSELVFQDVMELKLVSDTGGEGDDVSVKGELDENDTYAGENDASLGALAGGCCVDFNKQQDHLFIVGTEEGRIHKCSTAYNSQYIETYRGHHMAVYTTKWNEHAPNGACPRVSQIQRPRTLRFPNLTRLLDGRL